MISNNLYQPVALAIGAYVDQLYTTAKRLTTSAVVGQDAVINVDGESFTGQMRWYKPLSANINVASLSVATAGTYTDIATDIANYIKTMRTFGAQQVNLQNIVTKEDGLAKIARDFVQVRSDDESNAAFSMLSGVAAYEVSRGLGAQAFSDNLDLATKGFFVDINDVGVFGAAAVSAATARKLVDATATGAARGERLFKAVGMAFKDYEPEFMYLVCTPEVLAELRASNLVDPLQIVDGNISFQTIFGGKFRLVLTRGHELHNQAASANVNDFSTKTSYICMPGAISFTPINPTIPVEVQRNAEAYTGGGQTNIWYRYGFVMHPYGYHWAGATTAFAANAGYATAGSWLRKEQALNLGILPIFHA